MASPDAKDWDPKAMKRDSSGRVSIPTDMLSKCS
jgi:hypothetical protein